MWPWVVLTGDRINVEVLKENLWPFCRAKKKWPYYRSSRKVGSAVIGHDSLYGMAKTRGPRTTAKLIQNPSK